MIIYLSFLNSALLSSVIDEVLEAFPSLKYLPEVNSSRFDTSGELLLILHGVFLIAKL